MDPKINIIVVDDFAPIRQNVKATLESMGYSNIFTCANGREAWDILETKHISLIVSDLNMPVMTGQALLEKVRASKNLHHIPFVMVTAEGERHSVMDAIRAGVTEFIVKPFTPNSLIDKIHQALEGKTAKLASGSSIPIAPLKAPTSLKTQPIPDEVVNDTILVVDDSPENIDVIVGLLKPYYKVKAATNGPKAIKMVESDTPPDLILLDIMMPDMDGYEVCRTITQDMNRLDIPIIFLSAKGQVADITKGFELGAVDYATKPIEPEILLARIKTQLSICKSRIKLNHQIDTLVEMARLKEDVDRIMRHDMKNPISAISAHAQLLIDSQDYNPQQKTQLKSIQRSANQALHMLTSALDLYKMEAGTYEFVPSKINLVEILDNVIEDLEDLARAYAVGIDVRQISSHTSAIGEGTLCYTILSNLIKNAIEASPEKSKIRITIEDDEKGLAVRIYNSGTIPKHIRNNIFDKYTTANKEKGTGIGTYSAKMMALIQGGILNFETLEEKNTVFNFILF